MIPTVTFHFSDFKCQDEYMCAYVDLHADYVVTFKGPVQRQVKEGLKDKATLQ